MLGVSYATTPVRTLTDPWGTGLRLAFVQEYLVSLNGSQSYMLAGYKVKNADVAASCATKLLRIAKVAKAIAEGEAAAAERAQIRLDDVIDRFWQIK